MRKIFCSAAIVILCLSWTLAAKAEDQTAAYLKEGKLTEQLVVYQLQGGFAGLTGKYYAIESDGSWTTGKYLREMKSKPTASGKLTAEQLQELATELAKSDLATLPNHGKPQVNPKVTKITFGKNVSELQQSPGKPTEQADATVPSRYASIVSVVIKLCATKE